MGHDLPPVVLAHDHRVRHQARGAVGRAGADRRPPRMSTQTSTDGKGPLAGFKMIEMAGIGPGPFCAHGHGRPRRRGHPDRPGGERRRRRPRDAPCRPAQPGPALGRGRPQAPRRRRDGRSSWSRQADALIEGFRPGVMERLGLGPDVCLDRNPEARVRPDDRVGPGGSVRPHRRPRHQLHRAGRRARPHRSQGRGRRSRR